LSNLPTTLPRWLTLWMEEQGVPLWGMADLRSIFRSSDDEEKSFPFAIALAIPMNPQIMAGIRNGPNQAYADEYAGVNDHLNELSAALADELEKRGFHSKPLAVSVRTDPVKIKGDFPHKTAATRAGLGWIGRHCQLVTRPYGSWVRLGTVFTELELPCGPPIERSFCGKCRICVEACPAKALTGNAWHPGLPREEILDVQSCDQWKTEHYYQYHKGHNCGICSAVCPHGLKALERIPYKV
jgi:epoxyqueuosine reductase